MTLWTELTISFQSASAATTPDILLRCSPMYKGDPWRDFVLIQTTGVAGATEVLLMKLLAIIMVGSTEEQPAVVIIAQPFRPIHTRLAGALPPSSLAWTIWEEQEEAIVTEPRDIVDTAFTLPAMLPADEGDDREKSERVFWLDKSLYFPLSCQRPTAYRPLQAYASPPIARVGDKTTTTRTGRVSQPHCDRRDESAEYGVKPPTTRKRPRRTGEDDEGDGDGNSSSSSGYMEED